MTFTPEAPDLVAIVLASRPEWFARAACRGLDPELFHPERGESVREAKATCARCPVRQECLDFALDSPEHFGIWGGASGRDRRRLRRGQSQPRRNARCP